MRAGGTRLAYPKENPNSTITAIAAKIIAATIRISLSGNLGAALSPNITAEISAIIIPKVVPATTYIRSGYRAARAIVTSCVLSPISAKKNVANVSANTP